MNRFVMPISSAVSPLRYGESPSMPRSTTTTSIGPSVGPEAQDSGRLGQADLQGNDASS